MNDLKESVKKLLNIPPYNQGFNPCWNDSYYMHQLVQKHGEENVQAMIDQVKGESK